MDRQDAGEFGQAYARRDNIASAPFKSRKALQQRCREFARGRDFSLRVASNSWRKDAKEGNAKYVCKKTKGQQQLVPKSLERCPFYITVCGFRGEWKITRMCLAHAHYRHTGFHVDTFVDSNLSEDATRQRQRDVSFATLQGVLEREMLPAYSVAWVDVTGKAIKDSLLSKGYTVNRQTISQLKLRLLDAHQGDMMESYQKL
ncbi:hypothetical protein JG688_00015238 [Phytophthora aleatoria]|uniref:Uncharacterized protein n=1 Tax=Phytophthora aleatoria TaxID=2496075 RepID=A0A8J5IG24_9STRA|nr:hypothetical protein JG688_00015238 [Phytophthora aleatoria]